MLTSNITPKELGKKRIASKRLNIMRTPKNEGNFNNKENYTLTIINSTKKSTFRKHDREVKESQGNPFDIPNNMRMFSSRKEPKKAKPEPFIMSEPRTICDTDPMFYDIIKGRQIRPTKDVKVYITNIRDITLYKADAAYLKDTIILIDDKINIEKTEFNKAEHLYRQCVFNFVNFVKGSYAKAKATQTRAEDVALDLANISDKLEACSGNYAKLRNIVSNISYQLETRAIYANFLNSFAPDWWKIEYNATVSKENILPYDEFGNITVPSLSSLDEFKITIAKRNAIPYLFFMEPREMMKMFDAFERQCLNYMEIDVQTTSICKALIRKRDYLKHEIAISITEMEEAIHTFENEIQFYEDKVSVYKHKFEKILMTEFYALYTSYDCAKLFTCLQYVHTNIFGSPEDPDVSNLTLMQQIEGLYMSIASALDNLDQDVVKMSSRKIFADDIRIMKQAYYAQRTLKESDILTNALYRSFEPPRGRKIKNTQQILFNN